MSKFFIFKSTWDGAPLLRWLVVVAVINSIISVYYYLYPIVVMFFRPLAPGFVKPRVSAVNSRWHWSWHCSGLFYLGLLPNRIDECDGNSTRTVQVTPAPPSSQQMANR